MPKLFLTFDAQISYLESEKNLLIEDHDYARGDAETGRLFQLERWL